VFNFLITNPLTNLVLLFYHVLGENLGFAIILFTIFLRFVLLPLTIKQIKQQRKMAELQPRLQELQANRKDAKQMSAEEVALMRQTAGSCLGGCLPILVQIPIFFGLNSIITKIASGVNGDVFNHVLYFDFLKHDAVYRFNTDFFGFDLARIPSKIGLNTAIIPYVILIILLIVTQYIQSVMMMSYQKKQADKRKTVKKPSNARKLSTKEKEKVEMQEEMQKMMQMQTKYMLPLVIGAASYSFSAALGVYWLTQNIFAIVQTKVQNKMMDDEKNTSGAKPEEKLREVSFESVESSPESVKSASQKKKKKNKKKK